MNLDLRAVRVAGLPLFAGAVNGAVAYVAGLIAAIALYAMLGLKPLAQLVFISIGRPGLEGAAFAYYGGHFVQISTDGDRTNYAFEFASNGSLYVLLVATVLVSVGYYLGSADGLDSPRERAAAGATLVLGYLPLAALGATYFEYSRQSAPRYGEAGSLVMELPLGRSVVLAGLVVPVLGGAAGGLLADRLGSDGSTQSDD